MAANGDWYYAKDGQQLGPVSAADLKQLAATGQLLASDFIWKEEWPEWKAAGKVKGLFTAEPPAMPVPPPLPHPSANPPAASTPPSTASNVAGTMQAGLTDIMSTAKQAKDLAAAHARRTQITQMTLPKAYLTLGKDLFVGERFREEFSDLFQRINTANDEIAKVAATTKERPQATDLKGKLQSGAAQLMAQGQTTKLGYQRESLVRELGKKAFESHGTSAGSPELVSPITSANDEIAKLDEQIAGLSSGKQGSVWQRLPIVALLTMCCFPVGLLLVWLNPHLSRRSKKIWTGACLGTLAALMVFGAILPKPPETKSSTAKSATDNRQLASKGVLTVSKGRGSFTIELSPEVQNEIEISEAKLDKYGKITMKMDWYGMTGGRNSWSYSVYDADGIQIDGNEVGLPGFVKLHSKFQVEMVLRSDTVLNVKKIVIHP